MRTSRTIFFNTSIFNISIYHPPNLFISFQWSTRMLLDRITYFLTMIFFFLLIMLKQLCISDAPIFVFIHGGYWQEFSKDLAGFSVPLFVKNKIKVITVGYDLCPNGKMIQNSIELYRCLPWLFINLRYIYKLKLHQNH